MHRWLWLVGLLCSVASLHAKDQVVVKPDGARVTTRRVPLIGGAPTPCVALKAQHGEGTVVLPKERGGPARSPR